MKRFANSTSRMALLLAAVAALLACAGTGQPAGGGQRPNVGPPTVIATFSGVLDMQAGTFSVETRPTDAGRAAGMGALSVQSAVVAANVQGSLWNNQTGPCAAASSGGNVTLTSSGASPRLYDTWAVITSMSGTGGQGCNSTRNPTPSGLNTTYGVWYYGTLEPGVTSAPVSWAFAYSAGLRTTFSGEILATEVLAPVASVTVSLADPYLSEGQTTQASAVARDAGGNLITGRVVTWSTGNATAATVDQNGLVTAVTAGSAAIRATVEGFEASATVNVAVPAFIQQIENASSGAAVGALTLAAGPGIGVDAVGALGAGGSAATVTFPALTFNPRQAGTALCGQLDYAPDGAYDVTLQPLTDYATPKLIAGQTYHLFTRLAQVNTVDGLVCSSPGLGFQSCFKVGTCNFGGVGVSDGWIFSLDCPDGAAEIVSQSIDGDVFLRGVAPGATCTLTATGQALADSGTGTKTISVSRTFGVVADDADAPVIERIEFDAMRIDTRATVRINPAALNQQFVSGQTPPGFTASAPWFCGDPSRASLPCTTFKITGTNIADAAWKLTSGNMGGTGTEFFWQMSKASRQTFGMLVNGQSSTGALRQAKILLYTGDSTNPVILSFTATPQTVTAGQAATLSWSTLRASTLSIDQGVGTVTGSSVTVHPAMTTTYVLTITNKSGTRTASTTVTVNPAP